MDEILSDVAAERDAAEQIKVAVRVALAAGMSRDVILGMTHIAWVECIQNQTNHGP